jgi:hypothetical protein
VRRAVVVGTTWPSFLQDLSTFGWECVPFDGRHAVDGDAVFSSSPDESAHATACRLKNRTPWIADLRGAWMRGFPRLLCRASAITVGEQELVGRVKLAHPNVLVYHLSDAFDGKEWHGVHFTQPRHATLLCSVEPRQGVHDPRLLLIAIRDLLRERLIGDDDVRVIFYATNTRWLRSEIVRTGIASVVTIEPRPDRHERLRAERAASRLVFFVPADARERVDARRFYEYLGARRTLLAIGGGPERCWIDHVLSQTRAGERCRSVAAIRDAVRLAVEECRVNATRIVDFEAVAAFESAAVSRRLASVFEIVMHRALVVSGR